MPYRPQCNKRAVQRCDMKQLCKSQFIPIRVNRSRATFESEKEEQLSRRINGKHADI